METATPIGTIGGEAGWLLAISWATTGAAAFCFLLRLYTRLVVVKQYGWDDNIYNFSFVSYGPVNPPPGLFRLPTASH